MDNPWESLQTKTVKGRGRGVGLIEKAADIIDAVGTQPGAYRSSDLIEKTGLPRSSFYRVANALVRRGLLRVDSEDQTYHLGYRFLGMAKKASLNHNLLIAAEAQLRRLRDIAGETVYLGVLDGTEVAVLDRYDSPYDIRSRTAIGGRKSLHWASEGKALLAFLPPDQIQDLLQRLTYERMTERTVRDAETLEAQLRVIKFRGYATDEGEAIEGVRCIGVPILNADGIAVAAIGVAGPMFRFTPDRVADVGAEAMAAARRVSETLAQLGSEELSKVPSTKDVAGVAQTRSLVAFSPVWNEKEATVCWADPMGPALYSCKTTDGSSSIVKYDKTIATLLQDRQGRLIAGMGRKLVLLDAHLQPAETILSLDDIPGNQRIASARMDDRGWIWMLVQKGGFDNFGSSLWVCDGENPPSCFLDNLTAAPGFDWSPNGRTLYLSDPDNCRIVGYDPHSNNGDAGQPSIEISCPTDRGRPMGVAVDAGGGIWCPHWDGWCVTQYLADGEIGRTVALPVPRPSGCVFGGADGATLYVVTSRIGLSTRFLGDAPDSGALYAIRLS
jgi:DNA-binding IclR family transcriptional regulator/sugar lactone lactonase YvrE